MSTREPGPDTAASRRWLILVVGLIAMTAGCTYQYGLPYLIPALRHAGFSLEAASVLVACPTAGLLLTLIGWGAAADRWGERIVLASGLGGPVSCCSRPGRRISFAAVAAFPLLAAILVPVRAERSRALRTPGGWPGPAAPQGMRS